MASTTVTSLSYAGQKVLTVNNSTGFINGETIIIGSGSDLETGVIDITGTGTITLVNNLTHTHVSTEASDNVRDSNDTGASTTSISLVKLSTITFTIAIRGEQRFKFDLRASLPANGVTARIYKNGVALGSTHTTSSETYVTFTQNITTDWVVGDTLELWASTAYPALTAYVRNFRLGYDWTGGQTVKSQTLLKDIQNNINISDINNNFIPISKNLNDSINISSIENKLLSITTNIFDTINISSTSDILQGILFQDIIDNTTIDTIVDKIDIPNKSIIDTNLIIDNTDIDLSDNTTITGDTFYISDNIRGYLRRLDSSYIEDYTQTFIPNELQYRIIVLQSINNSTIPPTYVNYNCVVLTNTDHRINFYGDAEIPIGSTYTILPEFADYTSPSNTVLGQFEYIDNFLNKTEAINRIGTGLEDDQFYYYTIFTHKVNKNVAESSFSLYDNKLSTQTFALSIKEDNFDTRILNYWPNIFKQADNTGDFVDLMKIFGFEFNELYSSVKTFDLVNADKMLSTILPSFGLQTGISDVSYSLGVDHMRRIVSDLLSAWRLKGTKQGIIEFIRILTTWNITNIIDSFEDPVVDIDTLGFWMEVPTTTHPNMRIFNNLQSYPPIVDQPSGVPSSYTYNSATGVIHYSGGADLSEVSVGDRFVDGSGESFIIRNISLSFYEIILDTGLSIDNSSGGYIYKNTAISSAGRFFSSANGIIIPGFFDFNPYTVEINNIALYIGEMTKITVNSDGSTTLENTNANFGDIDSLVGNYILPKQSQINELFVITANTDTTITMWGIVKDLSITGEYVVLSPLNATRFSKLLFFMKEFEPSFARVAFQFI